MKNRIRQDLREKRKKISPQLYLEKSQMIRSTLESLPIYKAAKRLLVYISSSEEVDTIAFVKDCLAAGQTVFVPRVQGEKLVVCPITKWEDLEPGQYGILEPIEVIKDVNPSEIDLIIVPGIAFDKTRHRIGYGKGFYDTLLKTTKGLKIGLAFQEQILDKIPEEEHDVAMDIIITDQNILHP